MKDFSVSMALVDFIPVFLFGMATILLQKDLYNKMRKDSFALFAAGTTNVFCAGFLKALYKLLYAANICDFEALNAMFFPVQSIGFLLAGAGIITMFLFKEQKGTTLLSAAPVVWKGTFLFVGMMIVGLGMMDVGLSILAAKMKQKKVIVLFVISFVCSLCMGYLSSKDFAQASMNWIAEGVNVVGQGTLLFAVWKLHKAGLAEYKMR